MAVDQTGDDVASLIDDGVWRANVRRRLLAWFDRHARDLPWRREPTPYRVWVSEVMLQQTQVATVVDYYNRFLVSFPTVRALAEADEQSLMRLWEGLGYYRRARLMHQAAKRMVEMHEAEFPTDYPSVLALPGIGRYTAGAILSISKDARLPILEGNTLRVFSRWVALREDVKSRAGTARLWQVAEAMLPRKGSGRFNQAAMELGALICKPVEPQCDRCPVSHLCEAHRLGLQDSIPGKVTKMTYEDRKEFAFVVPGRGSTTWLVHRIEAGQRWAGLWDFPRIVDGVARSAADAAVTASKHFGVPLRPIGAVQRIKHAVTRFRITLEVHETLPVDAGDIHAPDREYRFVTADELVTLPLSTTGRKIASRLLQRG
ncbi:MAG: A/G-specific adenine glycosylase [Planctomycetaceae bacterium]